MKCMECGGTMTTRRENHKYDMCGLPGVVLKGLAVSRCPECGEVEVAIPNIEGLHRVMAQALARKREKFVPAEVRYLRKWLGFSGVDFASHMGVEPETVSRWEQGGRPMSATAERLLRWLVMTREPVSEYPLALLREVATEAPKAMKLGMLLKRGSWQAEAQRVLAGATT